MAFREVLIFISPVIRLKPWEGFTASLHSPCGARTMPPGIGSFPHKYSTATQRVKQAAYWVAASRLSLNPPTPFLKIEPYLASLDLLLVMTVNPGFGGQGFIADAVPKIGMAREAREKLGANYIIEVDGGITHETAPAASEQGADMFVAGSYIFGSPDIAAAIGKLRAAIG